MSAPSSVEHITRRFMLTQHGASIEADGSVTWSEVSPREQADRAASYLRSKGWTVHVGSSRDRHGVRMDDYTLTAHRSKQVET